MTVCRIPFAVAEGQSLWLEFDGERLEEDAMVQDTEITDMDCIDAHIQ